MAQARQESPPCVHQMRAPDPSTDDSLRLSPTRERGVCGGEQYSEMSPSDQISLDLQGQPPQCRAISQGHVGQTLPRCRYGRCPEVHSVE
jgi:hypothetical protein